MATANLSNDPSSSPEGEEKKSAAPRGAIEELRKLRRFHLAGSGAVTDGGLPAGDFVPALLVPLRISEEVRHDYPLFLYPVPREEDGAICSPVGDFLAALFDSVEGDGPPLVKRLLPDLEKEIGGRVASESRPALAAELFERCRVELSAKLRLGDEEKDTFLAGTSRMKDAIPDGGTFLGFGAASPAHLFLAAAKGVRTREIAPFRESVGRLLEQVRSLLDVEKSKDPGAREPEAIRESVGDAVDDLIDSELLSNVIGEQRGSGHMDTERRERLTEVASRLRAFLDRDDEALVHILHGDDFDAAGFDEEPICAVRRCDDPCTEAFELAERLASERAALYRAVRIGRLEVAGKYYPPHHNPWFETFGPDAFTRDERLTLPLVAAFDSADRIAGEGLQSLSRLLRGESPVHILVPIRPGGNPGEGTDPGKYSRARLELAYIGISLRKAWVDHSSAARPDHLARSFSSSLSTTRPALHLYTPGLDDLRHAPRLNTWLRCGIELEGRAHPFFRYNPEGGPSWASRFDFTGNPQPESDWPVHSLEVPGGKDGTKEVELPFTFADFAVLEERFASSFRVIPESIGDEHLIDVGSYIDLDPEVMSERIPFIWAVDGHGEQFRLAVTRKLALLAADRLSFWNTLQELAGVQSEYIRRAAEEAREKTLAEAKIELEAVRAAHAEEVETIRDDIVDRMVRSLTAALLGDGGVAPPPVTAVAHEEGEKSETPAASADVGGEEPFPPEAAETVEEETAPAKTEEAEETGEVAATAEGVDEEEAEDPWVDTPLCTSCNECTDINDTLFVYDENDQCEIGDPKGGTYEELVRAAENCPVGIIHPGTPLNPDEPNLDELRKRAAAFK